MIREYNERIEGVALSWGTSSLHLWYSIAMSIVIYIESFKLFVMSSMSFIVASETWLLSLRIMCEPYRKTYSVSLAITSKADITVIEDDEASLDDDRYDIEDGFDDYPLTMSQMTRSTIAVK